MAEVDNITYGEAGSPIKTVSFLLTGSSSTFTSGLPRIGFAYSWEGTNTLTAAVSGGTITFTGTNDDQVHMTYWKF